VSNQPPGQIITFYSYKGGTGRTMALANMAWVLASNGKRVLVVDWDLEAPGLHRFLHPFLDDKSMSSSEGVIDFVVDYTSEAMTPKKSNEQLPDDWYKPHANILRYATSINWEPFKEKKGTLDFVSAGKQGPSYATRVNAFNWQKFYNSFGGYQFMEAVKERMKSEYDYILLDSRTGVSDTSGICTVQMPDILVVCFTLNNQSIEGAGAVAEAVDAQRRDTSGQPEVRIFPVPTRVEMGEKERLELAREAARKRFSPLLRHIEPDKRNSYWGEVEILYEPYYAYEEILATFVEQRSQTTSMLASIERLTAHITRGDVKKLVPASKAERQQILAQYVRQRPEPEPAVVTSPTGRYWFYLSYARGDASPYLEQFYKDLESEVRNRSGLSSRQPVGFYDARDIQLGNDWPEETAKALQNSRVFVPLFSPNYFNSDYCGKEFQYFLDRHQAASSAAYPEQAVAAQILPVLWVSSPNPLPPAAAAIQYLDNSMPESYGHEGLYYLLRLQRLKDEYLEFCFRFAERLVRAAERGPLLTSLELPPLSHIESAFWKGHRAGETSAPAERELVGGNAGPSFAKFVYVAARPAELTGIRQDLSSYGSEGGREWRVSINGGDRHAGIIAQSIASNEAIFSEEIPVDERLIENLEQAETRHNVVLLIVDAWTLKLQQYSNLLSMFDRRIFLNCAILAPLNMKDPETAQHQDELKETLFLTFQRWRSLPPHKFWIGPGEDFKDVLRDTLIRVRADIIGSGRIEGGVNRRLSISKPTISGPGRSSS
jgi:FxsC-like protein